jgi:hypothetical protein
MRGRVIMKAKLTADKNHHERRMIKRPGDDWLAGKGGKIHVPELNKFGSRDVPSILSLRPSTPSSHRRRRSVVAVVLVLIDDDEHFTYNSCRRAASCCRHGHRRTSHWRHKGPHVPAREGRVYQLPAYRRQLGCCSRKVSPYSCSRSPA